MTCTCKTMKCTHKTMTNTSSSGDVGTSCQQILVTSLTTVGQIHSQLSDSKFNCTIFTMFLKDTSIFKVREHRVTSAVGWLYMWHIYLSQLAHQHGLKLSPITSLLEKMNSWAIYECTMLASNSNDIRIQKQSLLHYVKYLF